MKVSVSGKQFVFPRSCACCGGYPSTYLAVSGSEKNTKARTKGWVWDVPYCKACQKHVLGFETTCLTTLLITATSVAVGAVIAIGLDRALYAEVFPVFGLCVGAIYFWLSVKVLGGSRPKNCIQLARAVTYLGSNGSCHSFEIESPFYAAEFVRANHNKLVNVSPQVASILRGTKFGEHQVPRRMIRKS